MIKERKKHWEMQCWMLRSAAQEVVLHDRRANGKSANSIGLADRDFYCCFDEGSLQSFVRNFFFFCFAAL